MQITLETTVVVKDDSDNGPNRQELLAVMDWCLGNMTGDDIAAWVKAGLYVDAVRRELGCK